MTNFDRLFQHSYQPLSKLFSEEITFCNGSDSPYKVDAIVDREAIATDSNGMPVRVISVTVWNRPSPKGVPMSEAKENRTAAYVILEKRRGEKPRRVSILEVSGDDSVNTVLTCK